MTHTQKAVELIKWLLHDSGVTAYRISKDTELSATTVNRIVVEGRPIEGLTLKTANILEKYASNLKEEKEMEKIKEIINRVEMLKVEMSEDYDIDNDNIISHHVDGEDLAVYFAEKNFVQEARKNDTADELLAELNGLDDRFNYDKVIGYSVEGGSVVWL